MDNSDKTLKKLISQIPEADLVVNQEPNLTPLDRMEPLVVDTDMSSAELCGRYDVGPDFLREILRKVADIELSVEFIFSIQNTLQESPLSLAARKTAILHTTQATKEIRKSADEIISAITSALPKETDISANGDETVSETNESLHEQIDSESGSEN